MTLEVPRSLSNNSYSWFVGAPVGLRTTSIYLPPVFDSSGEVDGAVESLGVLESLGVVLGVGLGVGVTAALLVGTSGMTSWT